MKQSTENTLWIARDADNSLFIFEKKPYLSVTTFYAEDDSWANCLDCDLYPGLTFENSPKQLILS